jgi:hypothetical protein
LDVGFKRLFGASLIAGDRACQGLSEILFGLKCITGATPPQRPTARTALHVLVAASGRKRRYPRTVPLGRRVLRVVQVRDDDADSPPVLIVEELAQ